MFAIHADAGVCVSCFGVSRRSRFAFARRSSPDFLPIGLVVTEHQPILFTVVVRRSWFSTRFDIEGSVTFAGNRGQKKNLVTVNNGAGMAQPRYV